MTFVLSETALKENYRVESYDIVGSTNDLAVEFAKSHDCGHLWIASKEQTLGRGRRGRFWHSPKDNLYTSLLLVEDFGSEQVAQLGFVAGLSLIEALMDILPNSVQHNHGIFLKWPNDILIGKAKLAGILPEFFTLSTTTAINGITKKAGVIGIGVNIKSSSNSTFDKTVKHDKESNSCKSKQILNKENLDKNYVQDKHSYDRTGLQDVDSSCTAEKVFTALSHYWVKNYVLWNNGLGMPKLRDKWLVFAAFKNQMIYLKQGKKMISGIFETIDARGRLVLMQNDGTRQFIAAGDVYFGSVASASAKN